MEFLSLILKSWKSLTPAQRKAIGTTLLKVAAIVKKRLIDGKQYTAEEIARIESEADKDPALIGL